MRYQYIAFVMAGKVQSHKLPVATGYSDSMNDDDMVEMLITIIEALPDSLRGDRQVVSIYDLGGVDALIKSVPHVERPEGNDDLLRMPELSKYMKELYERDQYQHPTYCGQGRTCNCKTLAHCPYPQPQTAMRPNTTGTEVPPDDDPSLLLKHVYSTDTWPEHDLHESPNSLLHAPNALKPSPTHARSCVYDTNGDGDCAYCRGRGCPFSKLPEGHAKAMPGLSGTWPLEW